MVRGQRSFGSFMLTLLQEKRATSFEYGRYGNPTTVVLEEKIRLVSWSFSIP